MTDRFKATHDEVAAYIADWSGSPARAAAAICWGKIAEELEDLAKQKNAPKEYRRLLECVCALTELVRP